MTTKEQLAMSRWQTEESNLQSYRSHVLTAQSFLLTIGALVVTLGDGSRFHAVVVGLILIVGLTHIFYVWGPITRSRARMVDYFKLQVVNRMDEAAIEHAQSLCSAHDFVHSEDKRMALLHHAYGDEYVYDNPSRSKLDGWTRAFYVAVWLLLAALTIEPFLNSETEASPQSDVPAETPAPVMESQTSG